MKNLVKVLAMIGAGLLALGIIIGLAGILFGASFGDLEYRTFLNERYSKRNVMKDEEKETTSNSNTAFSAISELDIEIGYCEVIMETYDGDEILVEITDSTGNIRYFEEGRTLKLEEKKYKVHFQDVRKKVVMYLPEDQVFDEIDMSIGAGVVKAEGLKAKELDLSLGAGEVILEGTVNGDIDIECGAGNVELLLTGEEQDYNYKIETGVGALRINDTSYAALINDRKIDNGALYNFEVSCGVGNVEIDIEP